jgi:hypothetical protein
MTYAEVLQKHQYAKDNAPVVDTHETWTRAGHRNEQVLIDVNGGEWHHMVNGDINKVGQLTSKGLRTLDATLDATLGAVMEAMSRMFAGLIRI